jgi:hypothetical protein
MKYKIIHDFVGVHRMTQRSLTWQLNSTSHTIRFTVVPSEQCCSSQCEQLWSQKSCVTVCAIDKFASMQLTIHWTVSTLHRFTRTSRSTDDDSNSFSFKSAHPLTNHLYITHKNRAITSPYTASHGIHFYGSWTLKVIFLSYNSVLSRSQWPHGLRHEPSSPAQTLGSWVRIPLEAYISVFTLFFV